jgi:hypothetical protein
MLTGCVNSETRYSRGGETPTHPSQTPLHPIQTPMRDPGVFYVLYGLFMVRKFTGSSVQ